MSNQLASNNFYGKNSNVQVNHQPISRVKKTSKDSSRFSVPRFRPSSSSPSWKSPSNRLDFSNISNVSDESEQEISMPNSPQVNTTTQVDQAICGISGTLATLGKTIETRFDALENKIDAMSEAIVRNEQKLIVLENNLMQQETALHIPLDLKRRIKTLYRSLPDDEKWDLDDTFTTTINIGLTNQFVKDAQVHFNNEYTNSQIHGACKTYFQSLKKEYDLKSDDSKYKETSLQKKLRSRRKRLFEQRSKYVQKDEQSVWEGVTAELMSDEEDDGPQLKVKTPGWRSKTLTDFIMTLDARYSKHVMNESRQVLRKKRVAGGSPMKRRPTKKVRVEHLNTELETN